ncbi:MAG: glycosyltransferase [Pseudomonadota bacterium]|nr:glycosyltransferase [Pseudomonadota bacterium]
MGYVLASAAISFAVALFFVRQTSKGVTWGSDSDFDGPQKFHCKAVPRLGGVGILAALAICAIFVRWRTPVQEQMWLLVACGIPAMAYGLAEDITLAISPRKRMFAAGVSALLGAFALDAVIGRTDIGPVDAMLTLSVLSIPLTIFAVAGMANAVNIIDGFNGLAAMVCMMVFAAIAYVAYSVADEFILVTALCCLGALIGFFIWNFPRGMIFMGDGGAYFMGFMMAELAVLLVGRHSEVSPWFALLLFFYPTVETGFSIYRRRVLKGVSIASPDAAHLHSLIFRRLLRSGRSQGSGAGAVNFNSLTSIYMCALSLVAVVPAALFWNNSPALVVCGMFFLAVYLKLYQSIVRFKTPGWLRTRPAADQSLCLSASVVNESAKNSSTGSLPTAL